MERRSIGVRNDRAKDRFFGALYYREKVFLLFCFFMYLGWALVFVSNAYGPDETMRYDIPLYIFRHKALPFGNEREIINDYWGISYGYNIMLPYLFSAFFIKIASLITPNANAMLVAARLTSVLSGAGTVYFTMLIARRITKKPSRWIFIFLMALTPQIIFLSSYFNLDSFALFTVMFLIYCWIYGCRNKWNKKSCLFLGAGVGMCFLSYQFAYPFLIGSFIVYLLWNIINRKETSFKHFILNGLLVVFVAFLISGWYFIRNAYLYNGNVFALNASTPYAEIYAAPEVRPSVRQTFKSMGYSPLTLLLSTRWIWSTFKSIFLGFGYMNVFAPDYVYIIYFAVLVVGFAGCLLPMFKKGKKITADTIITVIAALISSITVIMLSVYYSWSNDYQAQGRYIIYVLPLIYAAFTYGINNIVTLGAKSTAGAIKRQKITVVVAVAILGVLDLYATYRCIDIFMQ